MEQYKRAIRGYLDTGNRLSDADALAQYALGLSNSRRVFLKAAVKLWGDNVALNAKSGATPENVGAVQATVYRLEALNEAIKVEQPKGKKAHTWLTQAEVKRLLDTCDTSLIQGQRDKIVLGLLTGAGLRRDELVNLKSGDVILQPVAGKIKTVLNIRGKGAKDRIVPINDKLAAAVEEWHAFVADGHGSQHSTAVPSTPSHRRRAAKSPRKQAIYASFSIT
jgi:integrase